MARPTADSISSGLPLKKENKSKYTWSSLFTIVT
jgi:hypothetical protein